MRLFLIYILFTFNKNLVMNYKKTALPNDRAVLIFLILY